MLCKRKRKQHHVAAYKMESPPLSPMSSPERVDAPPTPPCRERASRDTIRRRDHKYLAKHGVKRPAVAGADPVTPQRARTRERSLSSPAATSCAHNTGAKQIKLTDTAQKRISVCVLMVHGGLGRKKACKRVGICPSSFGRGKWLDKFKEGGMNAVLTDNRRGQKTVLTPTTTGAIQDWADTGMAANEIVGKLRQRRQTLSPIHQAQKTPTVRTIQMCLKNNGSKFTYKGSKFLVKTR